jgi:hypothetical protein
MPGKLTPTEKDAITKAANKAARFLTGKNSPAEELAKVFAMVEGLKGETKPPIIGKEAIALWQAKIDYAVANGDKLNVSKLINFPANTATLVGKVRGGGGVAFWDNNGGCNCKV